MSVKSWHDSDEISSDIECEAYNMFYYDSLKNNLSTIGTTKVEYLSENFKLDNEKSSDEGIKDGVIYVSDSDDSYIEKKIVCTNTVFDLFVGADSDDSDSSDFPKNGRKIDESSFILNSNVDSKNSIFNIDMHTLNDAEDSTEIADWSVDVVDTQPKSKFRSRYFDLSDSGVCNICLKKGHGKMECTRSGPVCILCGKEGHISSECDDIICHICFKTDHLAKKCPSSTQFLRESCKRCGQRGHNEEICPDVWRQYKYTIIPGVPLIQRCSSQNKHGVFCANCSRVGHFTDQCSRNRMASRFLGPPPIMEIIKYDDIDIYKNHGLTYGSEKSKKPAFRPNMEVDQVMRDMNVTELINDLTEDFDDDSQLNMSKSENRPSGFGDGYIMLSPISKPKLSNDRRHSITHDVALNVQCSTPGPKKQVKSPVKHDEETIDYKLPIIPEKLLRKLFPEETQHLARLAPAMRSKLRKKLKTFLQNGYLPGDQQITEDKMEFWLQEISTGKSLSYSQKKNLLGSVSAALHSIKDRVSEVVPVAMLSSAVVGDEEDEVEDHSMVVSIQESRRKRNKVNRQRKSIQNELKRLQNTKNESVPEISIDLTQDNKSKRRLRKRKSVEAKGDGRQSKQTKMNKSGEMVVTM